MTNKTFLKHYQIIYEDLLEYARKLTRNNEEARDIVQEASINAYQNRHSIKENEKFKSWTYRIVKNTFIDQFNKKQRRRGLIENAPDTVIKRNLTSKNRGVEKLKLNAVLQRINKVKDIYKRPFILYFKGYSYREIAQLLKIPIGTIKSRISTAKKKMKLKLADIHKA